jgi:arylsulfatase A-like enzyme/cytochrome c-type biogenesis protein CcmH/NrfG
MSKRKKRRKKRRALKITPPARDFSEKKEEEEKTRPRKKKILLLAIPFFLIIVIFSVSFLMQDKSNKKIRRDSSLNLMLITIDTIRGDRVGYAGHDVETPSLDSLAQGGASFMNAVCQVPLTLPSHASILTGTSPLYHQIRNNEDFVLEEDFTTLAELLKNKGYLTAAFVSAYVLKSQFGTNQGFDFYDDTYETPEALKPYGPQRRAEQVYGSAASWIEENHEKNFFIWVHFFDPHFPYTPPSPFDVKYKSRPYDGEIAYTDMYVGKLAQILKEKNISGKTLIVVVGDHGEDLWQHSEPTHGIFLYETTLKVPLLFYCPEIIPGGVRIKEQTRSIDIFPTILDVFRIDIPPLCQGISLVPAIEGKKIKETRKSYAETYYPLLAHGWSPQESIRTDKWKYIISPSSELYDLEDDPEETKNLIGERPEVVTQLRRELEGLKEKFSSSRSLPIKELTPEEKEKLRALGYVGGALPPESDPEGRPDPKDRIDTLKKLYAAITAMRQGELEKGEIILKELKREDPDNPRVYQSLGKIYQQKEDWAKAIDAFRKAVSLNPRDVVSYFELSQSYSNRGMMEEAARAALATLEFRPDHLLSLRFLAYYYKSTKNITESILYLERALQVAPSNTNVRLDYGDALVLAEEYERAIGIYQHLLAEMPENPQIYNKLGSVYFYVDDYLNAIEYFEKEVSLKGNPNSYFLLGAAYGKLGKYSKAVDNLEKYLTYAPAKDPRRQKAEATLQYYRSQIK